MPSVAMTGANGFLGWHTRAALRESGLNSRTIALGPDFDVDAAAAALSGTSRVLHLAGVNRGTEEEVRDGNALLVHQLAEGLLRAESPPAVVVYANSTQAREGGTYGDAKAVAADHLRAAAAAVGAEFHDLLLPNLFGEHGRPFYNAVTATFCHLLAQGTTPTVENDKELSLLHVQDAADILLSADVALNQDLVMKQSVSDLLNRLTATSAVYLRGEIPDVATKFDRDLFNTFRSYTFPRQAPIRLTRHADGRGSFFEIIRSHGGNGQSSFSTTAPSISRGDHFHRRKIERFTVLAGTATITLRRLFTDTLYEFAVSGAEPMAVDMPTMWTHKITNTGSDALYTSFWSNEIFDPLAPDTIAEAV